MADLSNLLFFNPSSGFEDYDESVSADTLGPFVSFKTTNYELSDVLLGKLANAINSSAGAGDAGKFIQTNGSGKVDNSFINFESFNKVFAAKVATTAALAAVTYNNGTSGVGATLTADANGALGNIDGQSLSVGDRILVKNQASALQNGIYEVTDLGSAGTPFILTRIVVYDEDSEIEPGDLVNIDIGTVNAEKVFILTTDGSVTVGTTALVFGPLGTNLINAGNGLSFSGLDLNVGAGDGIDVTATNVVVDVTDLIGSGLTESSNNIDIDWFVPGTDTPASVDKAVDVSDLAANGAGQGAHIIGVDPASISQSAETLLQDVLEDLSDAIADIGDDADYTIGASVVKGDLVGLSANDTIAKLVITGNTYGLGLSKTTGSSGVTEITKDNDVLTGVISGASYGDKYFWSGSALSTTPPTTIGNRVWLAGIAKNATDLISKVRYLYTVRRTY